MNDSFEEVVDKFITRSGYTLRKIAERSNISYESIKNWRRGNVRRPRYWQDIINFANALRLDLSDTNKLLVSAGFPPVNELWNIAQTDQERELLSSIQAESSGEGSSAVLAALRNALAELYPTKEDARVVVYDAGLDASQIVFSARAQTDWHHILSEAVRQNRLDDLMANVLSSYPQNPALQAAYADYRHFTANTMMPESLSRKIERLRKDPSRGQVTLSIPGDINSFTPKQLNDLVNAISAAAGIDPEEIFIQNITSGSVRVTLDLSEEAARKIVHELEQQHPELAPYSIRIENRFQRLQQHTVGPKVILCLAAEPTDTVWLQLGREHREIFESLHRALYGHHFMLQQIWAAKARDVLRYLLYYRPVIVHFSGHGAINGALLFEDHQGRRHQVEPLALRALFKGLNGDTRCVVLNSCYSDIQAEQIARHVDCVVGIEGEIENTSALAFASSFYEAIASGRSVKDAFILAQAELLIENLNGSEQVRLIWSENVNPRDVKFVHF